MKNNFNAVQKWSSLPPDLRKRILKNVYCSTCGITSIIDYTLSYDKFGILIEGKCKKCGNCVARLVEDE